MQKDSPLAQINTRTLLVRMLIGAVIGLVLISLFVFSADNPPLEWGKNWRIRPLIITPLAGAFGILSFYLKDFIKPTTEVGRILVFILSLLGFLIALWLGTVLGLDGTMWN
jgi:hypothetical protein